MISNLIIFSIGFLVACALVARKVWFLRTGKIIAGSYEEADWTDLSIENIRSYLIDILKLAVHKTVLFFLKVWILFTHFIRRTDKHVKNKLTKLIDKNGHYTADANQKPSEFLTDIQEHRDRVMDEITKEE